MDIIYAESQRYLAEQIQNGELEEGEESEDEQAVAQEDSFDAFLDEFIASTPNPNGVPGDPDVQLGVGILEYQKGYFDSEANRVQHDLGGEIPQEGEVGADGVQHDLGGEIPQEGEVGANGVQHDLGGETPQEGEVGVDGVQHDLGGEIPQEGEVGADGVQHDLGGEFPQEREVGADGVQHDLGGENPQEGEVFEGAQEVAVQEGGAVEQQPAVEDSFDEWLENELANAPQVINILENSLETPYNSQDLDESMTEEANENLIINGRNATIRMCERHFRGGATSYVFESAGFTIDEKIQNGENVFKKLFQKLKTPGSSLKANLMTQAYFQKAVAREDNVPETFYFNTIMSALISEPKQWLRLQGQKISSSIDNFQSNGSGWVFLGFKEIHIHVVRWENRVVAGRGAIKLPKKLAAKSAVITPQIRQGSVDCFKWAVLAGLFHSERGGNNPGRLSNYYGVQHLINFEGLEYPVRSKDSILGRFEKLNPGLALNVHKWENNGVHGVYRTQRGDITNLRLINLLLVEDTQGWHYTAISNIDRLMNFDDKVAGARDRRRLRYCPRCLRGFSNKRLTADEYFAEHWEVCRKGKSQVVELPKNRNLQFDAWNKTLSPSFVGYLDIESVLEKDNTHISKHLPCAAAYRLIPNPVINTENIDTEMKMMHGEGCLVRTLEQLGDDAKRIYDWNEENTRRGIQNATAEDKNKADCAICGKPMSGKVHLHHCHLTGRVLGPAHENCNMRARQERRTLNIFVHNLKGYDSHMLLKHALSAPQFSTWKIEVLPDNQSQYKALTLRIPVDRYNEADGRERFRYFAIKFKDSFQFLPSSLDTLNNTLESHPHAFTLKQRYSNLSDEVLTRKGVFPYSYLDSLEKFNDRQLPPIEEFHNDLSGQPCSEEDYNHAQRAWREFRCTSFLDYLLHYLELDVLILCDVFENFRALSLRTDGIDPVHYVSLPSYSFDAALKSANSTIHLLQDADLYEHFTNSIRGGLTFVNVHEARANNPNVPDYDSSKPTTYLAYIDQNNLYGAALSKKLPCRDFKTMEDEELEQVRRKILNQQLTEDDNIGYTLTVDLAYPHDIHEKTKDFPLAPEHGTPKWVKFSNFMKTKWSASTTKKYKGYKKLLMTQENKQKYTVMGIMLQFYVKMGCKISRIHSGVSYTQESIFKNYIERNSEMRKLAKNAFEKDFFKLKNNSLYGKTMEDVYKRISYRIVNNANDLARLAKNPSFQNFSTIDQDLVGVSILKGRVELNKPVFMGFSVLEYSKLEMFELVYHTLADDPSFNSFRILAGDTDSLFLEIETEDLYGTVFPSLSSKLDSSNYPPNHALFSNENRARLGCFKDEAAGKIIEEAIFLRPKMYSLKIQGDDGIRKAKGIKKSIVKQYDHSDYARVLRDNIEMTAQATLLRSINHQIFTIRQSKRSLGSWEDKRNWTSQNESQPFGFKRRRLD